MRSHATDPTGRDSSRAINRLRPGLWLLGVLLAASIVVPAAALTPRARAASTSVSSFSKTGVDESTGSTAAGGSVGSTAAGHTIDWVLSYRNNTGASASVNITDPITGNQSYVPGSLQTPPGFSGQWSTDGGASYGGSEPASGVNGVGRRERPSRSPDRGDA